MILVPVVGALEEPTSVLLTTTSVTDILSMAAGRTEMQTVVGIIIANTDGSACEVSVWWTENATDHLVFVRSIAANETVTEALASPIRLDARQTARKIKAQAATGNVVTVTVVTMSINAAATR